MARYGQPVAVNNAIDNGFPMVTFLEIDLPTAQGGPYYWCDRPFDYEYDGKMFSADHPFKGQDESRTIRGEEGTYALIMLDPNRDWFQRFYQAGVRGHTVVLHFLQIVPGSPPYLYKMGGFTGSIQGIRARRSDADGMQETRLIVEDKMFYTAVDPGEWTTDSFQRALDVNDDSHVIAHEARKILIHKAS